MRAADRAQESFRPLPAQEREGEPRLEDGRRRKEIAAASPRWAGSARSGGGRARDWGDYVVGSGRAGR
jgi:hypothetical protein